MAPGIDPPTEFIPSDELREAYFIIETTPRRGTFWWRPQVRPRRWAWQRALARVGR